MDSSSAGFPRSPILVYNRRMQDIPFFVKEQRNNVFEGLIEANLSPAECNFTVTDDWALLEHVASGSFLTFHTAIDGRNLTWRIGEAARVERIFTYDEIKHTVTAWAQGVLRDINMPDLWMDFHDSRQFLSQANQKTFSNTPFSPEEQAQIARHLKQIGEYIKTTYDLSSEQMSRIETKLDEAEDAAQRIGRKDWLLMFLGILFTLIVTGLVPPTAVEQILSTSLHAMRYLFGGGGNSLPGPADG